MADLSVDLSTAGIRIGFCIETTAGTMPTSGYTNIPKPKEIPDMNPEPNGLETSSLNIPAGGYKTYTPGLKDMGGSLGITFGMSEVFAEAWNDMCDDAATALADGKKCWFTFYHPGRTKSLFITGIPSKVYFPAAAVDEVWDCTAYITPTGEPTMATAVNPTDPS